MRLLWLSRLSQPRLTSARRPPTWADASTPRPSVKFADVAFRGAGVAFRDGMRECYTRAGVR